MKHSFCSVLSQHTNFYVMFCCCSKKCQNLTIFVSHTHLFFPSHKLNYEDLSCILILSKCICKDAEKSSIISPSYPLSRLLVQGQMKKMFLTVQNKLWADVLTVSFVIPPRFINPESSRVIPY